MKHRARGFTLIELVVTVAIVAVLASVAVPLVELNVQRAREHELRTALRQIRGALDAHKRATDEGRVRKDLGASGYPPTLEVLVEESRRNPTMIQGVGDGARAGTQEPWGRGRSYIKVLIPTHIKNAAPVALNQEQDWMQKMGLRERPKLA